AGEAYFIQAITGTNQEGMARAKLSQGAGHGVKKLGAADAEKLVRGACRVGERAEAVEKRTHLETAPHRRHVSHRGMKMRRKAEREPGAVQAPPHPVYVLAHGYAQYGEDIRAAAFAGGGPITVFDNGHTGARGYERR